MVGGEDTRAGAPDVRGMLDAVAAAIEGVAGTLVGVPEGELTGVFATLVRVRALAEGAAVATLAEARTRGVVAASDAVDPAAWVRQAGQDARVAVSAAEARAYADVAAQAGSPACARIIEAVVAGRVGVGIAQCLAREFHHLSRDIDPRAWEAAQDALLDYCAAGASARQLAEAREAILANYGLPGEFEDRQARAHARRGLTRFTLDRHGLYAATLHLDAEGHAIVDAALSALGVPHPAEPGLVDERSPAQRRADALVELCATLGTDPSRLPDTRPTTAARAHVVVTIDWDTLLARTTGGEKGHGQGHETEGGCGPSDVPGSGHGHGHGHGRSGESEHGYGLTERGQPLIPATVRRWACDAEIIPIVLGGPSEVLDVGHASRYARRGQVAALRIRDRGCSFPGCDRPPSWTEAHHLTPWSLGGPTDLDNLALLCRRHHTIVHQRGYTATANRTGVTWHLQRGSPLPRDHDHPHSDHPTETARPA